MLFSTLLIVVILIIPLYLIFLKSLRKNLKGKHVMISGGSSGIGLSVAREALLQGANVTLLARDENKLKQARDYLQNERKSSDMEHFGKVQTFSADVAGAKAALKEMVQTAENTFGPVYLLINCAGFAKAAKFEDISESTVKNMMDVNFMGSFFLTQVVVQSMKGAGEGGAIVFVSSAGGLLGIFGYTAYAASKGALVKMAEALHMELKPHNISVTVCYPPDTDTPGFVEENKAKPTETELISGSAKLLKPEEVAKALMEDALWGKFSSYVGMEGFMLTTLCAGMSPITDVMSFVSQVFLCGLFRLISFFYLWNFGQIVTKEFEIKQRSKRAE